MTKSYIYGDKCISKVRMLMYDVWLSEGLGMMLNLLDAK